jgi:hypothetical protein
VFTVTLPLTVVAAPAGEDKETRRKNTKDRAAERLDLIRRDDITHLLDLVAGRSLRRVGQSINILRWSWGVHDYTLCDGDMAK